MKTIRHNSFYKRVIRNFGLSHSELRSYTPGFTKMLGLFLLGRDGFDFTIPRYRRGSKEFEMDRGAPVIQWGYSNIVTDYLKASNAKREDE
jgi:hypothetical protein